MTETGRMATGAIKRSVTIAGHRTSVSLEPEFWAALKDVADRAAISVNALITRIDRERTTNLSSALRVHVLKTIQGADIAAGPAAQRGGAGRRIR